MIIKTKYDIGQKLWRIRADMDSIKMCECCGHILLNDVKHIIDDAPREIIGIYYESRERVYYKIFLPCVVEQEKINEIELEEEYYTTWEAAQSECDRRNNKAK